MKVLLVEPNADPRIIEIDGSLASMQELVGGLIEAIYPFNAPVALICNDEGKLAVLSRFMRKIVCRLRLNEVSRQ